jgi:alpha-beta hydrolase superfamily lysophospholipase
MNNEFTLHSADGIELFGRAWAPTDAPRAAVCLVHGFGEHGGRYRHVAERFAAAGLATLACDVRGHGQSGGARGYTPSYDALLDDITLSLAEMERRWPNTPHFLYGHSMGGNLVINHVLRRQPLVQGVIASSPWLRLTHEFSGPFNAYVWLLDKVHPRYTRPTGDDPANLTHDARVLHILANDPLAHSTISARLFWGLRAAGLWALAHAGLFRRPLLLLHGTADQLISPQATQEFAAHMPGDCTLQLWEGYFHELHNETGNQAVLETMVAWMGKH